MYDREPGHPLDSFARCGPPAPDRPKPGARPLRLSRIAFLVALAFVPAQAVLAQTAGTILPKGTVPVLRGVVSGSAVVSQPTPTATGNTLTIEQYGPQVIIDWNQFNIANGSIVRFIQPSSTASALNRIYSGDPSIIQGDLSANGQIFLINQNGILFDRGSQINVNTLYASTLNISNSQYLSGVVPASASTPTFVGTYDNAGNTTTTGTNGVIEIGAYGKADAAAPTLTSSSGGAIVLIAPLINNQSGVITSPDGQVILAAGNKAYLQFPSAGDTTLRGLVVEIDAAAGPVNVTSMVSNMGMISASRGNVTIAGLAVNQAGQISASTALQQNGSIYLQAQTVNDTRTGTVTLAAGSLIATPLDQTDKSTLAESESYDPYRAQVSITGSTIIDDGSIRAPAATVSFNATDPQNLVTPRIYLGGTSVIDVAGDVTHQPFSQNLLTFKVTANELNNSPDQKGKLLEGSTVTVDLNAGSTILDLSAYQANVAQNLDEKATSAGSVTLTSSGDIVQRLGSLVNANAGQIIYGAGKDPVTQLLGSDGKIYSITTAPEALTYTALLGTFSVEHPQWGQTQTYSGLMMGLAPAEAPYTIGGTGGAVSILPSSGLVLDGVITAMTTAGATQTTNAPRGGSLTIGQVNVTPGVPQDFGIDNVVFAPGLVDTLGASFTPSSPLPAAQANAVRISSSLFPPSAAGPNGTYEQNGFDSVAIGANQSITVPAGVGLNAGLGGSFTLRGQSIAVDGSIAVPAGSITLDSMKTVAALPAGGMYQVVVDGSLSTTGLWSNDFPLGASPLPSSVVSTNSANGASTLNGGTISIAAPDGVVAASNVTIGATSTIDVSAGGQLSSTGKITGGNGGAIAISAENSTFGSDASLDLDGTLTGFGFATGASLSIAVNQATISPHGTSSSQGSFAPGFFDAGGFSSYTIKGTDGVTVAGGTMLHPEQQNFVLGQLAAAALPSAGKVASVADITTLPDYSRAPVNLTLSSSLGSTTVQSGTLIELDPKGSLTLLASTGLDFEGHVVAPGGNVALTLASAPTAPPDLTIGSGASIDVAGRFVPGAPSAAGLRQGTVLGGGTVSISASDANLIGEAGSVINVSGASAPIDQFALTGQQPITTTLTKSNAGLVSVSIDDGFQFDATLIGHAAAQAAGGTFVLSYLNRNDPIDSNTKRRVVLSDAPVASLADANFTDADLALAPLRHGGFDNLSVTAEDEILFTGSSVTAAFARGVTLDSQQFDVANGTRANVSGVSVVLSNTFGQRIENTSGTGTLLDNTQPSLPLATVAGTGVLAVHAGSLDLQGSLTINGAAETDLVSQNDIRLTGRVVGLPLSQAGATLTGGLTTVGDIDFQGAQVYPTTRTSFTVAVADGLTGSVVPGGRVTFKGNGATQGEVLSAGGGLTVTADDIEQGGTIKAPLGGIDLDGVTTLNLLPGSTTSTSARGEIIPYGGTSAGVSWLYASTNEQPLYNALTAPPQKSMSLTGKNVDIEAGSKVDLSGGGDILGIEFVPGSGGTTDVLAQSNTYAILPAASLASMPVDTAIATVQNLGFGNPSNVYNEIHIDTGGVVPAGNYVLLPGYYALLPGAYIVQLQSKASYGQLSPGQSVSLANGLNVVPAQLATAGTSIESSQTIGVVVQPGSNADKLADYNQFGSSFFTNMAVEHGQSLPVVPNDAGQLTLAAGKSLALSGTLVTTPGAASSNAAEIDITGQLIAVVNQTGRTDISPDYLQIAASGLSSIDGSILIGGTRTQTGDSVTVTPTATDILVANNASTPLRAPELLLTATDTIQFNPGSVLLGAGGQAVTPLAIAINPSAGAAGAFIRASNSSQVVVTRSLAADPNQGTVTIESGATLGASGSLLVDATKSTSFSGTFALDPSAALSLSSSVVSLGDTPPNLSGLTLNQSELSSLSNLASLLLKSYGTIDVYGAGVTLGGADLQNLTLDGEGLIGHAGTSGSAAALTATAGTLTFENSSGTQYMGTPGSGTGTLVLDATTIAIGQGNKTIGGFGAVGMNAGEVQSQAMGTLDVAAPLTIAAARVAAESGSDQTWVAAALAPAGQTPNNYYAVTLEPAGQTVKLPAASGLGGSLSIQGADIVGGGAGATGAVNLTANAGNITLAALGGGAGAGITVGPGMVIDASGQSSNFQGTLAPANAGSITLTADHGAVSLAAQSVLNVSGSAEGGSAGTVALQGPSVVLGGALLGTAAAGQTQGSFSLDTSALPSIAALASLLSKGGFAQSIDLRARAGSVTLGSGDVLAARQVELDVDAGSITLGAGSAINASDASGGGSVILNAASDITLAAGSRIDAAGESTAGGAAARLVNGGTVALATRSGSISIASGAVIDVSAGAAGAPGDVSLTAPRTGPNGVAVLLDGTVLSGTYGSTTPAEVDVYGNQVYTVANVLTAAQVQQIVTDNQAFMASVNAAGIAAGLSGDMANPQGQVHVRPAVEIQSPGDLMIDPNDTGSLDLTAVGTWRLSNSNSSGPESGTLTVRAAGSLTLSNEAVGLPDNNLYPGYTWNINLVGGADLAAANVMQTQSAAALAGRGDVVLDGPSARVTSGNGNINIAAGHDFYIDNAQGVVYTSGVPVADASDPIYQRWATGGGNITISAQHDAIGSAGEWIDDWYRRTASGVAGDLGAWWAYRANFEDGIGALGGGNIAIAAGNDINNLSAFIPTSGRVYSPNPLTVTTGRKTVLGPGPFYLDVEGGGNLSVAAGDDIVGGQYLVGLGTGTISARGTVGAGTPTQLYLMGENQISARQGATINIQAGGSINLQSINDPTVIAQTNSIGNDPSITPNEYPAVNFLTYSPNSSVSARALGGDITVVGQPQPEIPLNPADAREGQLFGDPNLYLAWPASVSLTAFNGSISSEIGTYTTYASPTGSIELLAGQSVTSINIAQSDAGLPGSGASAQSNWRYPASQYALGIPGIVGGITQFSSTGAFIDDVVALQGSITNSTFTFPARSRLWAGTNVEGIQATLQNDNASDLSEIVANAGFLEPAAAQISIGGPGQLLLQAGGTIDLGGGPGGGLPELVATGNTLNAALSSATSARLTLVAGVSGNLELGQLDASYAELITAGLSKDAALAQAAAHTIFGDAKIGAGSIDTFQTSVQTDQGSGIDLLAPAGDITVGLTTPPTSNTTIGIVTNAGGAISSYLSGDFNINQGKVLTAQGGNILIYTTKGSIDAGRGAKTSLTTSPPTREPLYSGSVITGYLYTVSSAAAGSGIQTLTSDVGDSGKAPPAGNIYLFAPVGTVNAGEAGIVSGAGVFIEAARVLNASNISAAGPSVGVPIAQTGSLASSLAASGTSGTSGTDQAAAAAARAAAESAASAATDAFTPAVLTVEVLGFGPNACKETDQRCLKDAQ